MNRSRLEPQERREQLLDTAAALFAEKPYEDVSVEGIAACAGVSRSLMYRYFPSKRDLYLAIFRRSSHRLLARADADPQLPLAEHFANGLEAHIQYFSDHPCEAVAINRGAVSDDPAIQEIIADELDVIARRLTDKLVAEGRSREGTEIAVEAWLAFLRAACVKWGQSQTITRADLTELCRRVFECAVGYPSAPHARPKELTGKSLRRAAFGRVAALATAAATGSEHRNRDAWPVVCKATATDLIAKVQRSRDTRRQIKSQADHYQIGVDDPGGRSTPAVSPVNMPQSRCGTSASRAKTGHPTAAASSG